jgi:hypothetical protein
LNGRVEPSGITCTNVPSSNRLATTVSCSLISRCPPCGDDATSSTAHREDHRERYAIDVADRLEPSFPVFWTTALFFDHIRILKHGVGIIKPDAVFL